MEANLIIIGAGPGGYETAVHAAKEGLQVVLVEEHKVGGTCPTKAASQPRVSVIVLKSSVRYKQKPLH